jgi:hypothetical protein
MRTTEDFLRSMIGDLTFQIAMLRARVAELEEQSPQLAVRQPIKGKEPDHAPNNRAQ